MKLQSSILLSTIPALVHAGCLSSDPNFTGVSSIKCSYGQFKQGIKHEIALRELAGIECKKFKFELIDLFGGAGLNEIPSIFYETCDQALRDSTDNFVGDFKDILQDSRFVKEFYDGNTYMNQQVKQKRPTDYTFEEESAAIENFHDNVSRKGAVAMPDEYVDNFQQCDYNTVMCCYVSDRKVNGDGNGDCESPYPRASVPFDSNSGCIDADPADNT